MKTIFKFIGIAFFTISISACAPKLPPHPKAPKHPHHGRISSDKHIENSTRNHAPGQIKKRTGEKSAKRYAPGQRKKRN